MKNKAICIIPARSGSKRIPKKNIRDFLGKPIISYSIEVALKSNLFDKVMVSTDTSEFAEVVKSYGAEVPFLRSDKSATDDASTAMVIEEVLEEYKKINQEFEYICCLYPTAPFVKVEALQKSFGMIQTGRWDSVFPIVRFGYPIQRALCIEDGLTKMVAPEYMHMRSQDLDPRYHDCGQFYFLEVNNFLEHRKLFTENSGSIVIGDMECQDIDNEEDWKLAELKYKIMHNLV